MITSPATSTGNREHASAAAPTTTPGSIVGRLQPAEAARLLGILQLGYQQARHAAERACSDSERRARQEMARDLLQLTIDERASQHAAASRPRATLRMRQRPYLQPVPENDRQPPEPEAGG